VENTLEKIGFTLFPNPSADLIVLQAAEMLKNTVQVELSNLSGQVVERKAFHQGSTILHLETDTYYNGTYILSIRDGQAVKSFKVIINR
jgi:hypothetical protein